MPVDDAFTKVLLHMDGADASTTFTDESGKAWTAVGNAQIDTAQSKFGGASLLLDGTGDYITTPDSADFDLGSGDFTVDGWVRLNAYVNGNTYGFLFEQYTDANNFVCFELSGATPPQLRFVAKSTTVKADYNFPWSASTGTWYHIAYVRNGTNFYIFINGVSQALTTTTAISTNTLPNLASSGTIGISNRSGGVFFNGWLDELRISKGIARWTANFTPPTSAYAPPGGLFAFF